MFRQVVCWLGASFRFPTHFCLQISACCWVNSIHIANTYIHRHIYIYTYNMGPRVVSWLINPTNCSYKHHKPYKHWSYLHQLSFLGVPLYIYIYTCIYGDRYWFAKVSSSWVWSPRNETSENQWDLCWVPPKCMCVYIYIYLSMCLCIYI